MAPSDSEISNGVPLQIITAHEDDHTFELNNDLLKKVLLKPEIRTLPVVAISVAGAYRKGKSFLLDMMLRYLNSNEDAKWLDEEKAPLTGFHWRGGADRDTNGVMMWSKAFIRVLGNGERVAVVLLDTQGAFDSQSTVKDSATVFALSTLLTSVQVFNLMSNVQEDDLQHLQLFTEYGRLAMEEGEGKPFQKLLFLVRDWMFQYENDFGYGGGKELLDKRLKISNKHPELQMIRENIRECFDDIQCYVNAASGNAGRVIAEFRRSR